jgi:hypothetical protein
VSTGRTLVRFLRIRQVVFAVDPDTHRSLIEQECEFCELRAPVPPFRLKLLWSRDARSQMLGDFLTVAKQWASGAAAGNAPHRQRA